jgi:serine/threonine-protein kinase RsbW
MSQTWQLEIQSDPKEVMAVEKFLEEINEKIKLDEMLFNKLLVATTEAVNNGIIHGNKRDKSKKVVLRVDVNSSTLVVKVRDEGKGVDVEALPDPLAEENLMRENGRGVFLMKSLMGSVDFERLDDGWEVTMKIEIN